MKRTAITLFFALLAAIGAAEGGFSRAPRPRTGFPGPYRDLAELFDDRFFSSRFDRFAEMLALQDRFEIAAKTRGTDKEVVMELSLPGLDKDSLRIDVNESRVRVAYDAKDVQTKKDASGREYFRSESLRHLERVMPVPDDADGKGGRIEREGNVVKIIFPRRTPGVKGDI